jgi:hypothetical protein
MNDPGTPKPKRRWYQFSLRALFGLTTAVALSCAWFGYQYREGQRAKAAIEELGGRVFIWDYWDHRWGQAINADLSGTAIDDQDLARIVELPISGALWLDGTAITDKGLAHVQKWRELRSLSISDTGITDAGLEHLKHVTTLEFLQAHRTRITDGGVAELKRALPKLRVYHGEPSGVPYGRETRRAPH